MWLLLLLLRLRLRLLRRALLLLLPFFHRFLCFCSRPFHSSAHRLSFARLSHSFFSSLQSFQFRSREPFRPFFIQFKLPKLDRLFSFVRFVRVVVVVVGVEAHDERVIVVVGISSSSSSSSSSPSHGRRPGHERFPSQSFFCCVRVLLVLVASTTKPMMFWRASKRDVRWGRWKQPGRWTARVEIRRQLLLLLLLHLFISKSFCTSKKIARSLIFFSFPLFLCFFFALFFFVLCGVPFRVSLSTKKKEKGGGEMEED